ncbi:putative glutamate receptor [Frankliniella fusca]|uniref:Glutamate receptor n=1 Tax=Frankliniella fusca TaxID=407009 RepID=A0AAE1HIG6_9NEOP|nr:putative glutamate receptor [Frankliniella fusca]
MRVLAVLTGLHCLYICLAMPPEPTPPIDVQGMAELMTSFLLPIKAGVFVYGRTLDLEALLAQLHPETPRALMPTTTDLDSIFRRNVKFLDTDNIILVADDKSLRVWKELLTTDIPEQTRILLWIRATTPEDVFPLQFSPMLLWGFETTFAISTPNGSTFLYDVMGGAKRIHAAALDAWSPTTRRWQNRVLPFRRVCKKWRSPPDAAPLTLQVVTPPTHLPEKAVNDFVKSIGKVLGPRTVIDLVHDKPLHHIPGVDNCSLAGMLIFRSIPLLLTDSIRHAFYSETAIHVVVPTGMGPQPSYLQAVTDEFSLAMWVGTTLVVLAVASTTALAAMVALGRPVADAVADAPLQALAPLLGQAPPGRTAHRPLAAVWLLTSIVLAAAYQGLLLNKLTAPAQDINSLEELEQSGLSLQVSGNAYKTIETMLPEALQSRMTRFRPPNVMHTIQRAAEERKSAVILQRDITNEGLLSAYGDSGRKRLHWFPISPLLQAIHVIFTAGSPLQKPLEKSASLFQDHGLVHSLKRAAFSHAQLVHNRTSDEEQFKPLSLTQLQPAFLLLVIGHCLSTLVFVGEIVYCKWASRLVLWFY